MIFYLRPGRSAREWIRRDFPQARSWTKGVVNQTLTKRTFNHEEKKTMKGCDNFQTWADKIDEMPFDVHFTLLLVAPQALDISHAAEKLPEVDEPVLMDVGMHIRKGKHDLFPYDWEQYLNFLDKNL